VGRPPPRRGRLVRRRRPRAARRAPGADAVAATLTARGIGARGYYRVPCHQQPAFAAEHGATELPGTAEAARTHLAIPMSAAITRDQVEEVVEAIRDAVG
jgi:dTDP-4-amino-4,6-dideoxygalactose transaminase